MSLEQNIVEQENNVEKKIDCIHPCWGFVRVPRGYSLVTEGLTGKLKTKKHGFRFVWPWEKSTFIPVTDTPIDFKKEEYRSKEDYLVAIDTSITYKITDPEKFYVEENAKTQLQLTMSSILRRLVSRYNYKDLSEVNVILDNHEQEFDWIETELNLFESKYGVKVDRITIQKAELTGELKKAQEENAVSREVNKRNLAKADADKAVAEREAAAIKLRGEAEAAVISQKLEEMLAKLDKSNIPSSEKAQILREFFRSDSQNLTVIENTTGNDSYSTGAVFATMNNALNQSENNQQQPEQQATQAQKVPVKRRRG